MWKSKSKKSSKKGGARKRQYRPKRSSRVSRGGNLPERATLTETFGSFNGVTNTNYSSYNLSLSQCTRASIVAQGYQYFRIKRVTYVIKPSMDTFVSGGPSVPYLYYMIDRTRQLQNGFTVDQLKSMGAKPRRIDDKTVQFHYSPSVLTDTFDNNVGANQFVQYKVSPWLPTREINSAIGVWNPSTIDHTGIAWVVQQDLTQEQPVAYMLERRVEIEFKKPSVPTPPPGVSQVPIDLDAD